MRLLPVRTAVCLTAALLSAPLAASAAPQPPAAADAALTRSPSADRSNSWVVIHPIHHHRKYRQVVRISGQVRYAKGGQTYAVAGAKVQLLRRSAGASTWEFVRADTTSQTGKPTYGFNLRAQGNSSYRVRFGGDGQRQPAVKQARLWVHRRVPSKAVRESGPDLKLVGQVGPRWRGSPVGLLKRDCSACAWRFVRRQQTTSKSRFSFDIAAPRHGSWYYRVRVPGTTTFARSVTATYRTYNPFG